MSEIERNRTACKLIDAAAAYARRFGGCPENEMSPELRAMYRAWKEYEAAHNPVAA